MNAGYFSTIVRVLVTLLLLGAVTTHTVAAEGIFRWSDKDGAELVKLIESGEYGTITSVLILHNGERVFEHYANGAEKTTPHNTRSATKTIAGMAVGLACTPSAPMGQI